VPDCDERRESRIGLRMGDDNCCGGNGGGVSRTEVRARAVCITIDCIASLSLRSSSNLTFPRPPLEGEAADIAAAVLGEVILEGYNERSELRKGSGCGLSPRSSSILTCPLEDEGM